MTVSQNKQILNSYFPQNDDYTKPQGTQNSNHQQIKSVLTNNEPSTRPVTYQIQKRNIDSQNFNVQSPSKQDFSFQQQSNQITSNSNNNLNSQNQILNTISKIRSSTLGDYNPNKPRKAVTNLLKTDRAEEQYPTLSRENFLNNILEIELKKFKSGKQKLVEENEGSDEEFKYLNKIQRSPPTRLPITKEMVYNLNDVQSRFKTPDEQFYYSYKNLYKIVNKDNYFKVEHDLYSQMLSPTLKNKLLLPKRFGIKHDEEDIKQISVEKYSIGHKYSKMLSHALKHEDLKYVEKLNISKNQLSESGIEEIANSLPKNISHLDLGSNNIKAEGCIPIQNIVDSRQFFKLLVLNLTKNSIGDKGAMLLCKNLINNTSLQILDLSFNFITEKSMISLSQFIKNSSYILELYLQWNQINGFGGKLLAEGLKDNDYLSVLDISHNGLGQSYPVNQCGVQIILAITKKHASMKHLDLSYNKFCLEESKKIAVALENNHALYGFHFSGNNCFSQINPRGYLIINTETQEQSANLAKFTLNPFISGVKMNKNIKATQQIFQGKDDVCWICQGWVEHRFEYKSTGQNAKIGKEPIFLHLDFEGYQPILMERDDRDVELYFSYRMIPPEMKINFFFSNPLLKETDIAHLKQNYIVLLTCEPTTFDFNYCNQNRWKFEMPLKQNTLPKSHSKVIISYDYEPLTSAIPRDNGGNYEFIKSDLLRWKFEKSVFKDYKSETEDILMNCFEKDWACSRIPKFVKKEQDLQKLKELVRSLYPQILHLYKYHSAVQLNSDVFSVSNNSFTEFITRGSNQTGILDGVKLKLRDLDLQFVATNTYTNSTNHLNPERALIRFQFMEILVRLANDKYIKRNEVKTFSLAFQKILDDGLQEVLNQAENYQLWREKRLWGKECDYIFKSKIEFIRSLYFQYAGKRKNEYRTFTNRIYMTLNEFKDIWSTFDFYDDFFNERDVTVNFNLAIQIQVDELDSERHLQMNFSEFIEAFARIAEKFSPIPLEEDPTEWNEFERIKQSLQDKVGNLIDLIQEIQFQDKSKGGNYKENIKIVQKNMQEQQKLQNQDLLKGKMKPSQTMSSLQSNGLAITTPQNKKQGILQSDFMKGLKDKKNQKIQQMNNNNNSNANPVSILKTIAMFSQKTKQQIPPKSEEQQPQKNIFQSKSLKTVLFTNPQKAVDSSKNDQSTDQSQQPGSLLNLLEDRRQSFFTRKNQIEINQDHQIEKHSSSSKSGDSEDSGKDSEEEEKTIQNNFLNYIKMKKKIKFDFDKATLAYDEIFNRIVPTHRKMARRRSNLIDLTLNSGGALRKLSGQFKINLMKWGVGMKLGNTDINEEDSQHNSEIDQKEDTLFNIKEI